VQVLPLVGIDSSPTPFVPQPPTATYIPTPIPSATVTPSPTPQPEITLLFTGVIVPARCVQAAIDARGEADYLFAEVKDYISAANLAIGTINATISDATPHTGCVVTFVLVGDTRSAAAMKDAGFDLMSAATNHIKNCSIPNCGNRAFFDTLDALRANEITPIGAGDNLEEALQPVVAEVQGVRFGFVSLGMVEPMAFAGEDSPGIAILNEENLRSSIAAAREVSDVVIAMPHWGPEDVPDPNPYQQKYANIAVDAGADLVIGNHTHVVQAIQTINGIDVFYGLGNFVFDQTWDLAHQQGVMLIVHFKGTRYEGYDLIPTHVDGDGTVHIAGAVEAAEILQRIEDASDKLR
jgi:poly-gamma-glutamate synthesis protein (capsule biosynthesis protein)